MGALYRRRSDLGSEGKGAGGPANEALTNLSMYALTLDVEYHRLDDRLLELAKTDSDPGELRAVVRERDEIAAERAAFRDAVAALREQVATSESYVDAHTQVPRGQPGPDH
jgi:hypothetical protein